MIFLATIVSVMAPVSVWAHSDEYFDTRPSPHGGQVRMSGPYHFELTMSEKTIVVYVTDHADKPIATSGATAKLEINGDGGKTLVELAPSGGNMFRADWSGALSPTLVAKLTARFAKEKAYQATFKPFVKRN